MLKVAFEGGQPFSAVTLSMLLKEIYELAGTRTSSHSGRRTFATRLNAMGVGMRTIQKLMATSTSARLLFTATFPMSSYVTRWELV